MKRISLSLLFVGLMAITVFGIARAFFSNVEKSTGNKFVSGKLNLAVDNTCHYNGEVCAYYSGNNGYTPGWYWNGDPHKESCSCTWSVKDLTNELFFNFLDIKPGDYGENTVSLHVYNNDAWLCGEIANLISNDNGCDDPEQLVDSTCGMNQGELRDNLFFTIWKDNGVGDHSCNNILDSDETAILNDQPATKGIWPLADSTTGTPIPGNITVCYGVKWYVPLSVGNIIQSDSLEGDITFTAVQSRNMSSFKCSDLQGGSPTPTQTPGISITPILSPTPTRHPCPSNHPCPTRKPCIPDCRGRACGDDGCGGACGSCSPGQGCSLTQHQCITTITPTPGRVR